jgi:hypothetical protein
MAKKIKAVVSVEALETVKSKLTDASDKEAVQGAIDLVKDFTKKTGFILEVENSVYKRFLKFKKK